MPPTNQNQGGYQGTGKYGTFNGVKYDAPTASTPYGSATPVNPTTPVTQPQSSTITSASLAPVTPIPLPSYTPPTFGGIPGAIESLTVQTQAQNQDTNENSPSAQTNYIKALMESGDISSSVDRAAQNDAKKQSDTYTSQLEQEQLALRRSVESLKKNSGGMLASGIEVESERLNRESLSKQADIAILQTAANRNYDTAAAIADRQVAMKLEKSAANLAALKLLDDREFGEITKKKEREYNAQVKNEDIIRNLKLNVAQFAGSNAASIMSKLSAIDTTKPGAYDEAVKIAGRYANDPLDRAIKMAQLGKLNADINESSTGTGDKTIKSMDADPDFAKLKGSAELKDKLKQYQTLIDEVGAKPKGTSGGNRLDAAYQEVLQSYRAAKNLGALQGADLQLVDDAIKRATFDRPGAIGIGKGRIVVKKQANASIDEALKIAERNIGTQNTLLTQKQPSWVSTPYYKSIYGGIGQSAVAPVTEEEYLDSVDAVINSTGTLYQNAGFTAY